MIRRALFLSIILMALCHSTLLGSEISIDNNTWYIKEGFNKLWTASDFKIDDAQAWQKKKGVPIRARDLVSKGTTPFVTYTFITEFNASESFLKNNKTRGLFLPSIGEIWQIYLNGTLIADEYHVSKDGKVAVNRFVRGKLIDFPASLLKENNRLVIRVSGDKRYWGTGLHLSPGYVIGYFEKLQVEKSEIVIFMLITMYLLVGLYHIMLFVRRPKERYNLYFGIFGILIFIYFITRTDYIFNVIHDAEIIMRVEHMALFPPAAILIAFIETLFFEKESIISKVTAVIVSILTILVIFVPILIIDIVLQIWQGMTMILIFIVFYYVIKALRQKRKEARFLVLGIIVLILTITFDILDSRFFYTGYAFTKYGLFTLIMGIAAILANRFVRVYNEAEDLNVNLETKVKERTMELKLTLEEVQELKEQQDGDYYLTSLLMEPLSYNNAQSSSIVIEDLTVQKKKFSYRNKEVSIGGDLSVATKIRLHHRDYIAFINSDAMGKSIQGAGGALVTGVIYNSYINRLKESLDDRSSYPELWLRDCYLDLQNVFSSFNGQMLTSCIMGLVDEATGFMYYVNAEHPYAVLFRNGSASFLEGQKQMRKIGMADTEDLIISTFQLHPGDKIIIGSDGKDDIVTGYEEGARVINEDEKKFLAYVEESVGKLPDIKEKIEQSGEIMDDLSLLSIGFMPLGEPKKFQFLLPEKLPPEITDCIDKAHDAISNNQEAEALSLLKVARDMSQSNPHVLKEIVRVYIRQGKYVAAADVSLQFSDIAPWDRDLLYLASYANKLAGNLQTAIESGLRYYLRHKYNIKNLLNLADIYRLRENKERAMFFLGRATEFEPQNQQVKKLMEALQLM
jgi:serine phosphatase RsbU (regulator of sigma subunit)